MLFDVLEAGNVVTAVYEGDFAGDAAGEITGEEEGSAAYFELVYVAVEGGTFFYGGEDLGEVADAAGGEGLDRAGGDGVDADVLAAERCCEVADGGFECGLGDAHDVVVGEDLGGAIVGEGDDGSALGHEGNGGTADGDEGVDADVVGDAEALATGEEEVVLDLVGGGEGYGVDYGVDGAEGFLELGEDGVDLGVVGDVALEADGAESGAA